MNNLSTMAMVAGLAMASIANATAVSINYANTPGAHIDFNGTGGFSFSPDSSGDNFFINTGSAFNDVGFMTGTYLIGPVTTSGGTSTATVTGTGTLSIDDGSGHNLTGILSWLKIVQTGTGSTLNFDGNVNLTGVAYGGTNPDLVALAASLNLSDTLDFTFDPALTLTQLTTAAAHTTFSGSISSLRTPVPDAGWTAMLLGGALCALGLFRSRLTV